METSDFNMTQCKDHSLENDIAPAGNVIYQPFTLSNQGGSHENNCALKNSNFEVGFSQSKVSVPALLELDPLLPLSEPVIHGTPEPILIGTNIPSREKNSSMRAPSSVDGSESNVIYDPLSLQPPQSSSSKPSIIKRGPGRPRKDSVTGNTIRLPSGHKIKNLGVRSRKKADVTNPVGGSNLSLIISGDLSVGESPPRGAEDTAESDTSSVASSLEKLHEDFASFAEQWPGKLCAICGLGERSMLGQGDLLRLDISESFDPLAARKGLTSQSKNEKDSAVDRCLKPGLFARRQKGASKIKRLVSQGSLESMNEPIDEVCGYQEEPDYCTIFERSSGVYFVHFNCAKWSTGVDLMAEGGYKNLEFEVVKALNQRCQHCGNLGASLVCKADRCSAQLHFPCAALSGAFQDSRNRTLLCASHVEISTHLIEEAAICTVCDTQGDVSSLLMCSSCGRHYHGTCMALNSDPAIRAGWQCPACKVCQACRQPGDESKLLACDTCDKTYHIFCLRPALSSIPKHSWKCKMCRMCTDCGARTPGSGPSSRWHANFSVCDSCYQQRNKGLACPLCGKAYRHVAQKQMLQCHLCKKFVHGACDPSADLAMYEQKRALYPDYEFVCIPCKAGGSGLSTVGGNSRVLGALRKDELDEGLHSAGVTPSNDSFLSVEDDSFPGTESSSDITWMDKNIINTFEDVSSVAINLNKPLIKDKISPNKKKLLPIKIKQVEKGGLLASQNNGRKNRMNEFTKKRGPKPKLRIFGSNRVGMNRNSDESYHKGVEEPGVENRMVLCSARDDYVLQQDVCVMCGAFGNDQEGRLLSCAQCGQCYHPYCVNIKVTKVVLLKGWRCLDCTVCEGCGQRNDESRLILCDECDVSFHIYCIEPPLEQVPHGSWKCKWCAVCQYCGSNSPGYNSSWHDNYTKCGPCASQSLCPVCTEEYIEGDLIIKCFHCERWLHSSCDMIKDCDDAEKCADEGYFCVLCRPSDVLPPHLQPPAPADIVKLESPPKSPDPPTKIPSQFSLDGICLSEYGMSQIRSLTLDMPRKKRRKACNAELEAGILAAIESVVSGGDDTPFDIDVFRAEEMNEKDKDAKKRQKNIQKLGIGGFLVRLRGPRFMDEGDPLEMLGGINDGDKPKRKAPRKKSRNKLVELFPVYLQEAFFGKGLMEPIKDSALVEECNTLEPVVNMDVENTIRLTNEEILEIQKIKASQKQTEPNKINHLAAKGSTSIDTKETVKLSNLNPMALRGDGSTLLSEILPIPGDLLDRDLVDTIVIEKNEVKVANVLGELHHSLGTTRGSQIQVNRNVDDDRQKDEFTDFLSSQFNLESMESGLPSMDSKDVEDIFKGVLVEEPHESLFAVSTGAAGTVPQQRRAHTVSLKTGVVTAASGSTPIISSTISQPSPVPGSSISRTVPIQQNLASPLSFPPPSPYHSEYSNSPQFSPAFSEPPSPWPAPAEDSDQPSSYNQRSILKWEADESLGHFATISAVLYANINHPELKREHTNWAERTKQIAKIWRGLPTEKRAPYLQKARENRAASRLQKAQQMPKDIRCGGSSKKEMAQVTSPEGPQTSPKHSSSPDITAGRREDSSSINDTSASNFSCHAPASYLQLSSQTPPIEPLIGTYSPSNVVSGQACGNYLHNIYANPGTPSPKSGLPINHHNHLKESNIKFPFGDQSIKVLTPSEIMRSLPDLKQEDCNYALGMDQDKLLCGGKPKTTPRIETVEERQWKQMQALRQLPPQPLPHQDSTMKGVKEFEDSATAMHRSTPQPQFSPSGSAGTGMVQKSAAATRVPITQLSEISSQQLQVTTSELLEQKFPSLSSPRVPTQVPRFPPQPARPPPTSTDMPPPVPALPFIRKPLPSSQAAAIRSPNVVRSIPVSPRHTSIGKNENYGNSSPESNDSHGFSDSDKPSIPDKNIYNQSGSVGKDNADGRLPSSSQCQETRQHLRDLLQRQKKLEDPPTSSELPTGQLHSSWSNADEWQKIGTSDVNTTVRHQVPNSPQVQGMNLNQFRHPFLPPQVRSQVTTAGTPPVNRVGEYRMSQASSSVQPGDARARLLLNQSRTMMNPMQQNMPRQHTFIGSPGKPFQQIRNSLDPYGHLVVPQQRLQGPGIASPSQSMLAQQLGRPLSSLPSIHSNDNAHSTQLSQQQPIQSSNHNSMPETNAISSPLPGDHQELPDSVTAELEKLEQEQHDESNADTESGELADLGMDDDELLGMGADFNILEYADPELDQAVGGEKTNILDNLDLEEETKDVNKDLKRKDDSERSTSKKEGIEYSSTGKPIKSRVSPKPADHPNVQSTAVLMSPSKPSYSQDPRPLDGGTSSLLRPNQPPPPYPGPPPPYPGRPQMGIRNGCGVNIPSVVTMGLGVKNAGFMSGQPLPPQLPSPSMHANSNPHMSLHQRRTLLLQEQPLLLEDLLEQEKREQLRQGSGLISAGPEEPLLSDFDFERLKADVLSSSTLPVSLSPPNTVAQSTMVMSNQPPGISSRNQSGDWQTEPDPNIRRADRQGLDPKSLHPGIASMGPSSTGPNPRLPLYPLQSLPPPPNPPEHPATEQERQMQIQYEQWLYSQQQVLSMHLKCFETEVHKLRKVKKSLNSKQRQLRKNGNELTENDAAELDRIGKELPVLQKQLDQARKQSRQHNLLIQDYRNKQQKRQQMMGMSPGSQGGTPQGPSQGSPHACASSSPLLSKPQSPMLSPSPSMGPSPSPLMQNSPMASPLTPSPGPISNSLSQTSPRGGVNQNVHGVEEMAFSPNSDGPGRTMMSQNPANRIQGQHHMSQMRMGSPNVPLNQIMISQAATMNMGNNPGNSGILMARGMNSNLMSMQQQRPMMDSQCGMQRMRALGPHDQMRNMNPMGQRFQRMGMNQEHMMRSRPPPNFSNPSQMAMSSGVQHFNPVRIPFPNQSPTGSNLGNVRSPSPLSAGGLGSPPANQMMMSQNRVSPASSPMRRPSGSGSIGSASPMAERPQSVENPMTPRPTGSRPHTPIGPGGLCQNMEGLNPQLHHHHSPMENHHFNQTDNFGLKNVDNQSTHSLQNFLSNTQEFGLGLGPEYNSSNVNSGGGGSNHQILPFPTFSWFDVPYKLGLKGGNPSPVIHDHPACASNSVIEQTPISAIDSTQLAVVQDPSTQGAGAHVNNSSILSNSIAVGHESAHNLTDCVQEDNVPRGPCTTSHCPTQVVPARDEEFRAKTELLKLVVPLRDSEGQEEVKSTNAISPKDANIAITTRGGSNSESIINSSMKVSESANDNLNPITPSKLAPTLDYVSSNITTVSEPFIENDDLNTFPKASIIKNETDSSDVQGKSSDDALVCNSNSVPELAPVSGIDSTQLAVVQDPIIHGAAEHVNNPSIATNSIDASHERAHNVKNCLQEDNAPVGPCKTPQFSKPVVTVREEFLTKTDNVALVSSLRDALPCSGEEGGQVKLTNAISPKDANIAITTRGGSNSESIINSSMKISEPANDNLNPITPSKLAPTLDYISSNLTTVSEPFMPNDDRDTCPKASIIKEETSSSVLQKKFSDTFLACNSVTSLNDVVVKSEKNRILKITNLTPLTSMGTLSNPPFTASSIVQSILAQPHRPGPVMISTQSGGTNVTTVTSSISSNLICQASTGESQNALLKQLLQNTGCASTAQTSENTGFSLTSCLNSRPVNNISHLSEQATRIPQPAPSIRPSDAPVSPVLSQPSKIEHIEVLETSNEPPIPEIRPATTVSLPLLKSVSVDLVSQNTPDESEGNSRTGSITPTLFLEEESNKNDSFDKPPFDSKTLDFQKSDEEVKKARKRQYQSKRKQTVSSGKESVSPKKRPKKAVKPEEDFDVFIENLMTQLRQLPPVGIVEPDLGHNLGVRSVFGCGDLSKINTKGYNSRLGDLTGMFGRSVETNFSDYYNAKPYGRESSHLRAKTSPIHRGFYNQEFATPRHSSLDKGVSGEERLPTPIRESDTPDTIVSSSSPELDCRGSPDLFPGLKLIETDEDKKQHLRDSPTIPILIPIPIRPLLSAKLGKVMNDYDKENSISANKPRSSMPFKENGNITVTLTLSASAVDEIRGVLRNLANILGIPPPSYQLHEKTGSPPDKTFLTYKTKDGKEAVDIQSILNGTAKFCKHCDVLVLNNIIRKKVRDLPGVGPELESTDEHCFCSANCFMQFTVTRGIGVSSIDKTPSVVKHISDAREIKIEKPGALKEKIVLGKTSAQPNTSVDKVKIKIEPGSAPLNVQNHLQGEDESDELPVKKWKMIRYKSWSCNAPLPGKYKKPTDKELTEMLFRLGITVVPSKLPDDTRRCTFCHQVGDGVSDGPGRLLNYDVDKWIHLNCALWSDEVYETENGALVNVDVAIKQSLGLNCIICKHSGASVKCFKVRCTSVYHCGCAVKDGCGFYKNKTVFCPAHIPKGEKENELTSLSVFRRVYVQRDENRQVAVVMHHVDQQHLLRVGSLIFLNVGQLLPHQLQAFHTGNYIYPVGYKIVRFYWSMTRVNKRCQYICSIHEVDGRPEFRITAQEEGCKERVIKSGTAQGAWHQVLDAISKLRNAHDAIKVFPRYITGEDLFGLTEPAIVKVLESLPGIETLSDYHFKYGRNPLLELPLAINPSGCARSEPKLRTHFKRPHTQRTGASRASLPSSLLSSSEAACPYSKQFVHSKSSQYKKMKQEWRNNVYLARSKIQGLGLYAARDIERHTMVIEYIGEIIRNELAEAREKKYELQNRGIYMFRMDEERVIDATLCGGLARYINHSCNPNCVAETVEVDRDVRIIIFANRRISRGEELAYDYKFEVEDDQHKIPCLCGAPNCQQWMN